MGLTIKEIEGAKPTDKPYKLAHGGGLCSGGQTTWMHNLLRAEEPLAPKRTSWRRPALRQERVGASACRWNGKLLISILQLRMRSCRG